MSEIRVGQRWRSKDRRDHGRTVNVVEVTANVNSPGDNGFVVIRSPRRSRLRATTLRGRYELVTDAPTSLANPATEDPR